MIKSFFNGIGHSAGKFVFWFLLGLLIFIFGTHNASAYVNKTLSDDLVLPSASAIRYYGWSSETAYTQRTLAYSADFDDYQTDFRRAYYYLSNTGLSNDSQGFSFLVNTGIVLAANQNFDYTVVLCSTNSNTWWGNYRVGVGAWDTARTNYADKGGQTWSDLGRYETDGTSFSMCRKLSFNFTTKSSGSVINLRLTSSSQVALGQLSFMGYSLSSNGYDFTSTLNTLTTTVNGVNDNLNSLITSVNGLQTYIQNGTQDVINNQNQNTNNIINNNTQNKNDIINNQNANQQQTNQKLDGVKEEQKKSNGFLSSLLNLFSDNGSNTNASSLGNVAGWLPPGPIDSILNLPLSFLNSINNVFNSSTCVPISLTLPFVNSVVELPCWSSIVDTLGIRVFWESMGTLVGGIMAYYYLLNLYTRLHMALTLKEMGKPWGAV